MTKSLTLALLLSVSVSMVTASAVSAADAATAEPVKKAKVKKICKNSNGITGSRIAKRVCKTQEEWDLGEDDQEVSVKSKGGAVGN